MLSDAEDGGGWEPVANVSYRDPNQPETFDEDTDPTNVPPPPEFSTGSSTPVIPDSPVEPEVNRKIEIQFIENQKNETSLNDRPARQYVYGLEQTNKAVKSSLKSSPRNRPSHENIIEAEIRAQQEREAEIRKELLSRDKSGGSTSPSRYEDEGFVDRPLEEQSPPSVEEMEEKELGAFEEIEKKISTSETKIALELREMRERECELRALRSLQDRNLNRKSASDIRKSTEDVEMTLPSLATTDEGNYSEYGDQTSSAEDKSSDGSNSRIMSPDLQSFGVDLPRATRKPVMPLADADEDDVPVYTQMKRESVIEREIRLAREKEEAFRREKEEAIRREKGLIVPISPKTTPENDSTLTPTQNDSTKTTQRLESTSNSTQNDSNTTQRSTSIDSSNSYDSQRLPKNNVRTLKEKCEIPSRGVQRKIATSRIEKEIAETAKREKELRANGKIKSTTTDVVDSKVARIPDRALSPQNPIPRKHIQKQISTPAPVALMSPTPPVDTLTHVNGRLTRSLSTNNVSTAGLGMRVPQRGLMQKFIASRGKITTSAFNTALPATRKNLYVKNNTNGIVTRPMKVIPKASALPLEVERLATEEEAKRQIHKRTHATAEEKIQGELREMKKREAELRKIRARALARSQPDLANLDLENGHAHISDSEEEDPDYPCEMNGLRSALSNPNLLDDEPAVAQSPTASERSVRRRSTLIAQWEGRITQQTNGEA